MVGNEKRAPENEELAVAHMHAHAHTHTQTRAHMHTHTHPHTHTKVKFHNVARFHQDLTSDHGYSVLTWRGVLN